MLERADRAWRSASRWLGEGRRFAAAAALVVLCALGSWLYVHQVLPWDSLYSGDAHEYAVVARRLAGGEGFTSPVIFPAALPRFGAGPDHPSVLRRPLWPLVEAAFFTVTGPRAEAIHAALALCLLGTVVLSIALARALSDPLAALVAGLAVASCGPFLMFSVDGLSEPLFALLVTGAFLLYARGAAAPWVGATVALAALTRGNGVVLLPVFVVLYGLRPDRWRVVALCVAGFCAVSAPWWIRNLWVAGNPFYTLYGYLIYFAPDLRGQNVQVLFQLDPLRNVDTGYPLRKFAQLLPQLLGQFPFLAENAVALAGVVLGAVRRERASLGFLLLAAGSVAMVSLATPTGRYFTPLFPVMLAVGAAAWSRFGGRLAPVALVALLLAPLAPPPVEELPDIRLVRGAMAAVRAGHGYDPELAAAQVDRMAGLSRCFAEVDGGRPVVLAEFPGRLAWETDAIAIHLPSSGTDFWKIVDDYDVRFYEARRYPRVDPAELERRFRPRPDCAPDLWERREG